MLGLFSPGSAEEDVRCGGNLNNDLIAGCIRNIFCPKLKKSPNRSSSYRKSQ